MANCMFEWLPLWIQPEHTKIGSSAQTDAREAPDSSFIFIRPPHACTRCIARKIWTRDFQLEDMCVLPRSECNGKDIGLMTPNESKTRIWCFPSGRFAKEPEVSALTVKLEGQSVSHSNMNPTHYKQPLARCVYVLLMAVNLETS